jgi:signal peptidase I
MNVAIMRKMASATSLPSRFVWGILLPAGSAVLIARYLVPPRMEGASGGLIAALGRLGSDHPLALCVGLFLPASLAFHYWRRRLSGAPAAPAQPALLDRRARLRVWARFGAWLVAAVVVALSFRSSLAEMTELTSSSMVPTLMVGDRVVLDKLAYGFKLPFTQVRLGAALPRRGDVVAFDAAALPGENLPNQVLIKRVIGLPGDRISTDKNRLVVNGSAIPICDAGPFVSPAGKQTVKGRLTVETLEGHTYLTVFGLGGRDFPAFKVPPGELFVVGDDRVDSNDSRTWNAGRGRGLPASAVQGRVTRFLAGSHRDDGRLDVSLFLSPLAPKVRQPGVDLARTNGWLSGCLQSPKPPVTPPAPQASKPAR